ncbi:BolA domain UV induced protein Uvi31 [Coemansia furcata]|uniref:BolA domain UV induced protein Uvi31 n=1 Tax=Coemansia furcata TaxID=417177 RepID=A0ACC1LQJ9_9FUNG|nr:BolA domain UV induced protein Uvi31 [Coemansia furcata]
MSTHSKPVSGPMEMLIRKNITDACKPTVLKIENESYKHRHHAAMRDVDSTETHFKVTVVSEMFSGQNRIQRQRLIYSLLKAEMAMEGGIHALTLVTKTPEEHEITAPIWGKAAAIKGTNSLWTMIEAILEGFLESSDVLPPYYEGKSSFAPENKANPRGPGSKMLLLQTFSSQLCMLSTSSEGMGVVKGEGKSKSKDKNDIVVITTMHQVKDLGWKHVYYLTIKYLLNFIALVLFHREFGLPSLTFF